MKKGILLAVLLCVCLLLTGCEEESYPTATDRFFVNDFAEIMSETDRQTVYETGVALQQATDAQVVLVTVQDTGWQELEDFAYGLASDWQIGDAEKDNGILLLFTVDGPHSRLEIGYGLEGALPDSKAGRILDTYLVPWYEDDSAWSAQLTDTYKAVVNEVYAEYGMEENRVPLDTPINDYEDIEGDWTLLIPFLIILLVIVLTIRSRGRFLVAGFGGPHRGGYYGGFGGFRGGGGFGGGGGGFSGGGGGFGGGGASR